MNIYIDFESKVVRVVAAATNDAGWCAFSFAKDNPELIKAGWWLYFYPNKESLPSRFRTAPPSAAIGPNTLSQVIRAGPPKSCCYDCCCKER